MNDLPDAELDRLQAITAKYPDDPLFKAGALDLTLEDDGPPDGDRPRCEAVASLPAR